MLKLVVVLFTLLAVASATSSKLRVHRTPYHLRAHHKHPWAHDKNDFFFVETTASVGTPFQMLNVELDTVASDLELVTCPTGTQNGNCFSTHQSSTFKRVSDRLAADTVLSVFQKSVTNVTFSTSLNQSYIAGNIGLGWPDQTKYPGETMQPAVWFAGGQSQFAIAISPLGTFGEISWGTTLACRDNPTTVYLNSTSNQYWQFAIDRVRLGKVHAPLKSQVVIDTKTEYIGMPKHFLDDFTKEYGIQWDGLYQAYTIECDKAGGWPDLVFKVAERELRIRVSQYVYFEHPLPNGKCVVNFEDSKIYGFGPEWYFGTQIMTDYCVGFDFDRKLLSFTMA